MKSHYLGKADGETLLGVKTHKDHSVFKNPNAELKAKIAAFKINMDEVEMGWPEKMWKIVGWEGDEAKCKEGKNTSYFTRKEINEALSNKLEYERNQAFQAFEYFKEAFGVISWLQKNKGCMHLRKIDLENSNDFIGRMVGVPQRKINPLRVEGYETFFDYELSDYNGIELKVGVSGRMLSLFFNENGDYVNRDYNEDMTYYECKDIHPSVVFEGFEKRILALGKLKHSKGKYYTDKFCFIPYFYEERGDLKLGVQMIPARDDGKSYQENSGCTIYKKPAKLEDSSAVDLLKMIKSKMSTQFSDLFKGKPLTEIKKQHEAVQ